MFGKEAAKIAIETLKKWYQKIKNINDIPELKEKIEKLFDDQKIINEITNKINNIQNQSQNQSLTSSVPFDEYKNERDLKDKCFIKLEKLKQEIKNEKISFDSKVVKKDVLKDLNNSLYEKRQINDWFLSLISGNLFLMERINLIFPYTSIHIGQFRNKKAKMIKIQDFNNKQLINVSYNLPSKLKTFLKKTVDEWYQKK